MTLAFVFDLGVVKMNQHMPDIWVIGKVNELCIVQEHKAEK